MTQPTLPLPNLYSLPEVAERYRLSLRSLRERARRREFTHIQLGRERYMTDEQIRALLDGATVANQETVQRERDMAATGARVGRRRRKTPTK